MVRLKSNKLKLNSPSRQGQHHASRKPISTQSNCLHATSKSLQILLKDCDRENDSTPSDMSDYDCEDELIDAPESTEGEEEKCDDQEITNTNSNATVFKSQGKKTDISWGKFQSGKRIKYVLMSRLIQ